MTLVSGWARYPVFDTKIVLPHTMEAVRLAMIPGEGMVARGNGRAYGDAAIGAQQTIVMGAVNRIRAFDFTTGEVRLEAGILLADIIGTFLPQGFFPRVVPGTRFVTIGGAIAADVHGKNHHRDGGFSNCVESLLLALPGGEVVRASREVQPELFAATVGGMGLTGTILEATLRLHPVETGWIRQRTVVARDLAAALAALDDADSATYSVAWIDSLAKGRELGRSLIFLGEHARVKELDSRAATNRFPTIGRPVLSVPFDIPRFALSRWTAKVFNELYFQLGARAPEDTQLLPAYPYFFPLDAIGAWNRIYGQRGFIQHQCVLPLDKGPAVLADMLERIAAQGGASFLAVLKKLGSASGLLSFPFPGYTLALDFPVTPDIFNFLEELDRLVVAAGGRLYLAKDARQSRTTFEAGYSGLPRFREIRRTVDKHGRIKSRLAERLGI